jgi:hypothetical protein
MHETHNCYGTLRAIGKISVKNAKRFDKKWRFSLILRYFQNDRRSVAVRYDAVRYDTVRNGTIRYGSVRYGTLENSDKNGLPTVGKFNPNLIFLEEFT